MKAGTAKVGRSALAILTVISMAMSLMLLLTGTAEANHVQPDDTVANDGPAGTNDAPYWENYLASERGITNAECSKINQSSGSAWVMPAAPEGEDWVLLVVKQGTTNFVYYDPVAGHTYPSVGENAPGYSHIIVCSAEEPPPPPSGWACVDGQVEFIEDATEFDGTLYETEEAAANDPACAEEPPSGWACIDGEVQFIEDATEFEGTLYETEEEAANDPACSQV